MLPADLSWVQETLPEKLIRISLILLGIGVLYRSLLLILQKSRLFILPPSPEQANDKARRVELLYSVLRNALSIGVLLIGGMMVLGEFGINLAPLIAGASVAGVAIGFGVQNIVRDLLYGFFILSENQFGISDVIKIGEVTGKVERMTLRTLALRDDSGRLHILPNSEATKVAILSQDWSAMLVDVELDYEADLDRAFALIDELNQDFYTQHQDIFLEPPKNLGLDAFNPKGMLIRIVAKTLPNRQWDVIRLYRKALKIRLNQADIPLAYPYLP